MSPQEAEQLQQRVKALEALVANLTFNGEYRFLKNVNFGPKAKLSLTGDLSLGISSSKVGFYGATPVARQAAISPASGGTVIDIQARSVEGTIISRLQTIGITF